MCCTHLFAMLWYICGERMGAADTHGCTVGVGLTVTHGSAGTWALAELLPDPTVMHNYSEGLMGFSAGHAHCL